jgi:hypothetical protein
LQGPTSRLNRLNLDQNMINHNFIYLGVLLEIIGGGKYINSTLQGETKPNRVTWLLWVLGPLMAFVAQIRAGFTQTAVMTASVGFIPLLVLLASFANPKSYWKITKFDIGCGILSLIGLLFWKISDNALFAILFSIIADLFATFPTLTKSWTNPETENTAGYIYPVLNSVISMMVIKTWNAGSAAYPIYIFLNNLIMYIIIKFKVGINRFWTHSMTRLPE